jgi:hypothetical protein
MLPLLTCRGIGAGLFGRLELRPKFLFSNGSMLRRLASVDRGVVPGVNMRSIAGFSKLAIRIGGGRLRFLSGVL